MRSGMKPVEGRRRCVIENVRPEMDSGRFPIKRSVGERVVVEADIFGDGHDLLQAALLFRREAEPVWREAAMSPLHNDRWRGDFTVDSVGCYRYSVLAWVDRFRTWRHDLVRRLEPADIETALRIGSQQVASAAGRAGQQEEALWLRERAVALVGDGPLEQRLELALSDELADAMDRNPDRRFATRYDRELPLVVDPTRARFSAWYELFPRSVTAEEEGAHGSFRDVEAHLPYIASMGFDILYFPPIHPIGRVKRKGRNNTLVAAVEDPGSPWAIGSTEGGHKSVHPQLGTLEEFRRLVDKARDLGLEVAIDIAFQCAPDHPYVADYPVWFRHRPDGSVQYAENPPKKYEDIYPFDFESGQWRPLWDELKAVLLFWVGQGVRIFRVDNPHTKPFVFWEWVITEVKGHHPEAIFLSEAFSRPRIMHRLAKVGFTQSYTYFTWRNTKWELIDYMSELTQGESREYFRPNFWPNTPDILSEYLQFGGRAAFMARLVLAATLAANYGIYGAAYELLENQPREPGSEEYLNSEKYEIKHWPIHRADSLRDFIARVNRIRRDNPALQSDWNLRFCPVDNEQIIAFAKWNDDLSNIVLVVVNLDSHHTQSGWVEVPLDELQLETRHPYQMHDLLTDSRYLWQGRRNYVELDPSVVPAQIFRLRRRVRSERDFEYYM